MDEGKKNAKNTVVQSTFHRSRKDLAVKHPILHNSVNWILALLVVVVSALQALPAQAQDTVMMQEAITGFSQWTYMDFDWAAGKINLGVASYPDNMVEIRPRDLNGPMEVITGTFGQSPTYTSFDRGDAAPIGFDVLPEESKMVFSSSYDENLCPRGPSFGFTEGGNVDEIPFWFSIRNYTDHSFFYRIVSQSTEWQELSAMNSKGFNQTAETGKVEVATSKDPDFVCATLEWRMRSELHFFDGYVMGDWFFMPIWMTGALGLRAVEFTFIHDNDIEFRQVITQDTISEGWIPSATKMGNGKVNVTLATTDEKGYSEDTGRLITLVFDNVHGQYGDPVNLKFEPKNYSAFPARHISFFDGMVNFGTHYMSGAVQKPNGNALPNALVRLQGANGSAYEGGVGSDGTFQIGLDFSHQFTLTVNHPADPIQIGIEDFVNIINCSSGQEKCDPITSNTYPADEGIGSGDIICVADFWLLRPRTDCTTGTWTFDYKPHSFNQYTPGLLDMQIIGRQIGDIELIAEESGIAAMSEVTPSVEFQTPDTSTGKTIIPVRVSGQNLRAVGLIFEGEGVTITNVTSNLKNHVVLWDSMRALPFVPTDRPTVSEMMIYLEVRVDEPTTLLVAELDYGSGIIANAAEVILEPNAQFIYLPALNR